MGPPSWLGCSLMVGPRGGRDGVVSSGTTSPLLELLDSPSFPLLGLLGSPSGPIRLPLLLMGPRDPILDKLAFRLTVLVELLLLDTMGLCKKRSTHLRRSREKLSTVISDAHPQGNTT